MATQPDRLLVWSALRLLLMTGARRGEICGLRWRDVDLDRGSISLERDKAGNNRRDILLRPEAVALLKTLPRTSSPFVFPADSKSGHLYYLDKAFDEAVAVAGVRRVRLHDLRHASPPPRSVAASALYVDRQIARPSAGDDDAALRPPRARRRSRRAGKDGGHGQARRRQGPMTHDEDDNDQEIRQICLRLLGDPGACSRSTTTS